MGQEGQLGLGESRTHVSTPCLLSYSHLAGVRQIEAGDSYSAAVTADGELFLWGRIPCLSRGSDPSGERVERVWTPQPIPLARRKVYDMTCGTWHMMALTTRSREKKRECALPETGARFKDLFCNPLPMEHTEKENTEQICFDGAPQVPECHSGNGLHSLPARQDIHRIQHKLFGGLGKPEGPEDQEEDEERDNTEEEEEHEERAKEGEREGDGALHDPAVAVVRSPTKTDGTGYGRSSITSNQGDEREAGRTAGLGELRKEWCRRGGKEEVVFTTLHLLPRSERERQRPPASALPRLLTGQQSPRGVVAEGRQEKSTHLSRMVHKSGSDSCVFLTPRPIPKPRPPGRRIGPEAQTGEPSFHCPSSRQGSGLEAHIYKASCHHPSFGLSGHPGGQQQVPIFSPLPPGHRLKASPSPTFSTSSLIRRQNQQNQSYQYQNHHQNHGPIHRRAVSSFGTSWKDSVSTDPVLPPQTTWKK